MENDIIIYKTQDGKSSVDVMVDKETVWLSLNQLSTLFVKDKSVISKHLRNIFKEKELSKSSVVANFATTAKDGKVYHVDHFNLDAIISLGYRVNSKQGVQFRKWATQVLNSYLINGFSINQSKLTDKKIEELQKSIDLLSRTLMKQEQLSDIGTAAISLIRGYSKTWHLLLQYDENNLSLPTKKGKIKRPLDYKEMAKAILSLKEKLISIKEATDLFGIDSGKKLESILNNIQQTFGKIPVYQTIEISAAHLFYFIIKDHPFVDGNKRIACLLFVLYLQLNGVALDKISDATLTALALLVAESNPSEKDLLVKLVVNLIA